MAGDLEDFGEEMLMGETIRKFGLERGVDYSFRIGVTEYKEWAHDFGARNIDQAYEDPWKSGWFVLIDEEGNERKFGWKETKAGLEIFEKKE